MTTDLVIGVLYSARHWRGALQRYVRDHATGIVLRILRDSATALEEALHVVVVDDIATFLTPVFVASLRDRGVKVVGVFDPDDADAQGLTSLTRAGVDAVVPTTMPTEELVARLVELAPSDSVDEEFHELVATLDLADDDQRDPCSVIAIGGPSGAGGTEVAIATAELARRSTSTILVDVDEVSPGVARRLGLGLHPHLLTVLDAMRGVSTDRAPDAGDPIQGGLARPAPGTRRPPPFDVIVGLANRRDWPLVRAEDVRALLVALAARWSTVVVNLGPQLEDMSRWVDRFAASRAAAAVADTIVGVCEPSPRGLLRFLDWLTELADVAPAPRVIAVVNRAPGSRFRQAELEDQLWEHAGPALASVIVAPVDAAVERAAWDGVLVGRGRFLRAIERLASEALPARHFVNARAEERGATP